MIVRRRYAEDEVAFQITPMIDMTFLLLIFFMVTSKLSKEQVKREISLPVAAAAVVPSDVSNRDIINIDEKGQFFVGERQFSAGELRSYLAGRLGANPKLRLYVRADQNTPAKTIKLIVSMAASAGAGEVIVGSRQD